jgi:hypothetical protein
MWYIYLWSEVVCFVFSPSDLPHHSASYRTLSISLESSWWVGVHWLGLRLFGAMVWKVLIIEPFTQWKWIKIETENCIGIWGCSWCWQKPLSKSDLTEFISQFSELSCERYWFLSGFCCWKFKQIAKISFELKNQSRALDMFTLPNLENFNPENVKNKECVHTWANSTSYTSRTY